jgi:WD40 repeat protein
VRSPEAAEADRLAGRPARFRYDAFISHSHEQQVLADRLQRGLHRLGRRWYQLRRLNVFRDVVNLSPGGSLSTVLERAVRDSRCLILLASGQAAESRWVEEECRLWLASGGTLDRLVVVLVTGTLATSLPPSLRGLLDENWLVVDVRGLSPDVAYNLRHAEFFNAVAGISAKVQGIEKDALVSEDYRNRRRALRLAASAVAVMSVLAVAAGVLAWVAFDARADALRQRDTAVSRAVANASRGLRETNPELSRNLAVAAYRLAPTAEATSAVIDSVGVPARINLPGLATGSGILFSPSSDVAAVELDDRNGNLTRTAVVDLTGGRGAVFLPESPGRDTPRAFSADGALLATVDGGGTVELWNPRDAAPPQPLGRVATGAGVGLGGLEFSPAGRQLAVCRGDGSVGFYDMTDPHSPHLAASLAPPGGVAFMRYNGDGTLLALALRDGRIALVDLSRPSPSVRAVFGGHAGPVFNLAFSPDGALLASSGYDERIRVWATRAEADKPLLAERIGSTSGLYFAHADRALFASSTSEVNVYDLGDPTGLSHATSTPIPGTAVAVDAHNRRLATKTVENTRTVLHVWDIEDLAAPRRLRDLPAIGVPLETVAFSRDGNTLYTADQYSIDVWDVAHGRNPQSLATVEDNTGIVTTVQLVDGGRLMLTGSWDGTARLYDTTAPDHPRLRGVFETVHGNGIAAMSPDGRFVAVNDQPDHVALWDVSSGGQPRWAGGADVAAPTVVEFSPDSGSVAIGNWSGVIEVWDVRTSGASPAQRFEAGVGTVNTVSFAGRAGSGVMVVGGFHGLGLWDLATAGAPRLLGRFIDQDVVTDAAFDAKRNLLATVDNRGGLLLWAVGAGRLEQLARVETERLSAVGVAFDTDAARLVAGSADGRIALVSVEEPRSPDFLGSLSGHADKVNSVAVGPHGLIASASNDHSVMTWNFDTGDMADYICVTRRSPLSPEDWSHYIPDAPFRDVCNR